MFALYCVTLALLQNCYMTSRHVCLVLRHFGPAAELLHGISSCLPCTAPLWPCCRTATWYLVMFALYCFTLALLQNCYMAFRHLCLVLRHFGPAAELLHGISSCLPCTASLWPCCRTATWHFVMFALYYVTFSLLKNCYIASRLAALYCVACALLQNCMASHHTELYSVAWALLHYCMVSRHTTLYCFARALLQYCMVSRHTALYSAATCYRKPKYRLLYTDLFYMQTIKLPCDWFCFAHLTLLKTNYKIRLKRHCNHGRIYLYLFAEC